MSEFWNNADEIYQAITGMLEKAKQDPVIVKRTEGMNFLVLYEYTNPDIKFWVDSRGEETTYGMGEPAEEPTTVISMDSDDAHRAWSNKLNVMLAITRKKLRIRGEATKLLKMTPLLKRWAICYNAQLREMGKDNIVLG